MADSTHVMSATRPKYYLGDLVVYCFFIEGQLDASFGYITGVEYKPPFTHVDNWWYAVRLIPGSANCSYDQVPEGEIIGRVLHGT